MTKGSALPDPPSALTLRALGFEVGELRTIAADELWWRVHTTEGNHVLGWNALRTFGPILRFDPHSMPRGDDPRGHAVWCGASTPDAALAEAFQLDRTIERHHNSPYLTGLSFVRPLIVLDVAADSEGAWATRAGGTGPHVTTQRWARHIVEAHPDLDGIRYNSRFAGAPCIAVFAPAADAMPDRPTLSLPLTHPDLVKRIAGAAKRLGYGVV